MEGTVIVFCFAILISSTCGRIAVTDTMLSEISNDINDEVTESEKVSTTTTTAPELLVIPHVNSSSTQPQSNDSENKNKEVLNNTEDENSNFSVSAETKEVLNNTKDESSNFIDTGDEAGCVIKDEALILTPLIEEGKLDEARRAAEVNPDIFYGVKSYSGFFTVNKTYNSNIFFWYIPVEKKLVNETPWLFWLQGGPGASSMIGMFDEIGPFKVNRQMNLVRNPYTWLQNHSLVFIENPVGTGFSFTNHEDGYVTDMGTYTEHLYSTLKQLLLVFPELKTAPLFIAGESYAGKYVPALGYHIHKHNEDNFVNLQGFILGNGYVDPGQVVNITRSFHEFGMVVDEQVAVVQPLVDAFRDDIAANRSAAAKDKFNTLIALLLFLSNQKQAYNFLKDELSVGKYEPFLARADVKRALHVGALEHEFVNITVNYKLGPDFLTSTRHMIEELLNDYKLLIYCGQLDQMLPCSVSSEQLRQWTWRYSKEFQESARSPFILHNRLVGYFKSGGHLTEVLVRGGGHMVAIDQPLTARELVARWTHGQPLGAVQPADAGLTTVRELVQEHAKTPAPVIL